MIIYRWSSEPVVKLFFDDYFNHFNIILIFNDNSVVKLSTVWTTAPLKPLWSQIQFLRLLSVCPLIVSILQLCCFNLIFFSGQKHDWMWKNPGKLLLITPELYAFYPLRLRLIEIRCFLFEIDRYLSIFLASEMTFFRDLLLYNLF